MNIIDDRKDSYIPDLIETALGKDAFGDLRDFLISHEDEIHHGINDFDDLDEVFKKIIGRVAGY